MKSLTLLSLLFLLSACAESLEHFHRGNKVAERHYVPGSWGIPGQVSWTECRPSQMVHSIYWAKQVCPDTIDESAPLAIDRGAIQTASYKDLVVPAAIHGAFFVGGMSALGAIMPSTNVTQTNSVTGSTVRTSTLLINSPVPGGVAP